MFIDLSVVLNEQTPVYPGDPKIAIKPSGVLEKDGFADCVVTFGNHNGTHVDAPSNMIKDGKTLDQIPIEKFTGKGVLVNVKSGITLDIVQRTTINQDDIVLFYTGMSERYDSEENYKNYPAISEEIANFLVGKKVRMVGVDMCSIDDEPFTIHKILLKNEILIIENLTNLSSLQNKNFTVFAFPLKFQIDGSPVRVVAEVE